MHPTRRGQLKLLTLALAFAVVLPQHVRADHGNVKGHKCKITNRTGQRVQVRILQYDEKGRQFKEVVENGETFNVCKRTGSSGLRAGDRAVIAWSCDKEETIVAIGKVVIDGSKEIVLRNDGTVTYDATDPNDIE
jgi:hypothetical protein